MLGRSEPMTNSFYPAASNHISDDPTPKDQAIYVPSITPGFAIDIYQNNWSRAHPAGIKDEDLNILDPNNKLFRISHALSSAGQAMHQFPDCIVTKRDRKSTLLICDSGGYQTATLNRLFNSNQERQQILDWLETHADFAMTLDAPSSPILEKPNYYYNSTAECLEATLEHLKYFDSHRTKRDVKFLNVLHGNNQIEADHWYDQVKVFPFEGFAFAGKLRNNIYEVIRRILIMYHEGRLQSVPWLHVLGCGELYTAVLLTAIQRAINTHLEIDLRISFDTSTPFRMLSWGLAYTIPTFDKKTMSMASHNIPNGFQFMGSDIPWPWPSPLGNHLRMRDICVPTRNGSYQDQQSNHYIAHHNLAALCWGIALANRIFDAESLDRNHTVGMRVGAAVEAIDRVFQSKSLIELAGYQAIFARLKNGYQGTSGGIEDRNI